MNEQDVNTIMTYAVRMQKMVVIDEPGKMLRFIEWSNSTAQPRVYQPTVSSGAPIESGIVGCVAWLRQLPKETTFRLYTPVDIEA